MKSKTKKRLPQGIYVLTTAMVAETGGESSFQFEAKGVLKGKHKPDGISEMPLVLNSKVGTPENLLEKMIYETVNILAFADTAEDPDTNAYERRFQELINVYVPRQMP